MSGGVGLGYFLTGKLGYAWVSAWVYEVVLGWMHGGGVLNVVLFAHPWIHLFTLLLLLLSPPPPPTTH